MKHNGMPSVYALSSVTRCTLFWGYPETSKQVGPVRWNGGPKKVIQQYINYPKIPHLSQRDHVYQGRVQMWKKSTTFGWTTYENRANLCNQQTVSALGFLTLCIVGPSVVVAQIYTQRFITDLCSTLVMRPFQGPTESLLYVLLDLESRNHIDILIYKACCSIASQPFTYQKTWEIRKRHSEYTTKKMHVAQTRQLGQRHHIAIRT